MKVYKVTEKGQVTIPFLVREALGLDGKSVVEIWSEGDEVRMRKVSAGEILGPNDPIWRFVGVASSDRRDVSESHDRYLAEGERIGWRESSRTRARSTRSSTGKTGTTARRSRS